MTRILSIQSNILGHKTYCSVLRSIFDLHSECEIDSFWSNEERTIWDRLVVRVAASSVPFLSKNNIDIRRARAEWAAGYLSKSLVQRKLREKKYDALHFHTQVQALASIELMKDIPTVISIDLTAPQVAQESAAGPYWTYRPSIRMEKRAFDAASHIVTWSDWTRNSVISDQSVEENRVTTIPPGVPLDRIGEPRPRARGRPNILFVGNDLQRKGGYQLIEVFRTCLADQANLHIMSNESVAIDHPNVFFYRGVSAYSKEWFKVFWDADILVLNSFDEAYGLVLQEAAAFGLALVGTRIGAIPEIIADGENGLLVPPGNQYELSQVLRLLVRDVDMRRNMQLRSREIALLKFDARKNFTRLSHLFQLVGSEGRLRK